MRKILFVCHGNICRSPMAHMMLKHLKKDVFVDSKATSKEEIGNTIYPKARQKLEEKGIPILPHVATQVTQMDYDFFDEIYVMDQQNKQDLLRIVKEDRENKIHFLHPHHDILDPWYTDDFETAYQDILEGLKAIC